MPALARWTDQQERPKILSAQLGIELDSCKEIDSVGKNKLKKFLVQAGIQSITELDYPLRRAYEEYLIYDQKIKQINRYLLAYDRIKQYSIRQQMKTLEGQYQCRWEMTNTVLFIPYHPDQSLAMEYDSVRHQSNMVWDFSKPCSRTVKEQIFTTLNAILESFKELRSREHKLSGLQCLYEFCTEEKIKDIEMLDAVQVRQFEEYLEHHTRSKSRKAQLLPSLNFCLKTVFLQSGEINWDANVWYLERLHLPQNRVNHSSSFASVSFRDISLPSNRRYLKEYMKYQFGISSLSVSTIITTKYIEIHTMLVWFSGRGRDAGCCTAEEADEYIKTVGERGIIAKTFNSCLSAIHHFFRFLVVKGHMGRVPFRLEYYQKKVMPKHLNRSVSSDVCMEMLEKLPLLPEHLRCMYLHLWCLGLRISEVCTLKGDAYEKKGEDAWIKVYQTKMKTYKRIPIAEGLYKIMQVYIKRNHIAPDEYLFKNKNGGAYRTATFSYQMKKFCRENDVEGGEYLFQSHDYRHTVATFFYDNGVSLQSVRDYLGHNYEEMTQQYIDYMPQKIAEESDEFFKDPGNSLAAGLKKHPADITLSTNNNTATGKGGKNGK